MNIPFTIRQLEVFTKIAQGYTLTQAADLLRMSQSAASMSLSELEKALQGPVFQRISRRLVLNDRGRQLLPKAQSILQAANETLNLLIMGTDIPHGSVVIGCSTTIASYWIPPLLKYFDEKYPNIEIHLKAGNTDAICKDLLEGKVDFGLVEGEIDYDTIEESLWTADELVLIAHQGYKHSKSPRTPLQVLADEKWILREKGSGTRSTLEDALKKEGLVLQNKTVLGHTEAVKRAVENGLGISCLSRISVARELELGFLSEIYTNIQFIRWFRLVTVKGQYISPSVKYVIEVLHELSQRQEIQ